ncbi:carbohydrate ABC transporter permease [Mycetocola miduiensis]|uniref:Multiple sugar transport system permease protein n=1 Tax=Mycetocola miduiensis TaxID=995034 RepID=A0A1I5AIT2_9MICO|nr:carbohydrate ABC transporter permease [Mycetocola miduiensis]SFN62323.1 multiple sugar transport system permease protein [Mycetocola miduiensis]
MVKKQRITTAVATLLTIAYLLPVYWMVATSLKSKSDIFNSPPDLVPSPLSFDAYAETVFGDGAVWQGILSSTIISVPTLILTMLLAIPAAYGLARFSLKLTGAIMLLMLGAQMLPSISLALPLFAIFSEYNLVDTYASLIIANIALALPFAIVILRPYMLNVPQELLDAARIDGCTTFGSFVRIALPLMRPGLIMAATLTFVSAWGEFVFGLTLATSDDMQPITVVLNRFVAQFGTQWGNLMAVSTIVAIPIILIFIFLQKYVVAGLSEGGVKD